MSKYNPFSKKEPKQQPSDNTASEHKPSESLVEYENVYGTEEGIKSSADPLGSISSIKKHIYFGIEKSYLQKRAAQAAEAGQTNDPSLNKKHILRVNTINGGNTYISRLQRRLMTVLDQNIEENHPPLRPEQQEFLIDKISSFLSEREVHELNLYRHCLTKTDLAKSSTHPVIAALKVTEGLMVKWNGSNCLVPDYVDDTKNEYIEALKGIFIEALQWDESKSQEWNQRKLDAQQPLKKVTNPLNTNKNTNKNRPNSEVAPTNSEGISSPLEGKKGPKSKN